MGINTASADILIIDSFYNSKKYEAKIMERFKDQGNKFSGAFDYESEFKSDVRSLLEKSS